jgi:hypothetical protein
MTEASLERNLVADPRVSVSRTGTQTVISVSANPEWSVASFQPTTLHGQLDTGEPVTLLDAQNYGRAGDFAPRYRTNAGAIVGAHVSKDQLYSTVRFRMDRPYWPAHLADGESSEVEDDGSTLTVNASGGDNWLVYESSMPVTLRQLELRVVSGCLALLQLALYPDKDRATRETQVQIERGSLWLSVHGPAFCAELGDVTCRAGRVSAPASCFRSAHTCCRRSHG